MIRKQTLEEKRISKVSYETGIPEDVVKESIDIMFRYIRAKVEAAELSGNDTLSSEDFRKKVPIMKIPGLGFMVPNYKKYLRIKINEKTNKKHK